MENLKKQILNDIKNLKNKKFEDLPTEQNIFKNKEDFEKQKNLMIEKWNLELQNIRKENF